MIEQHLDPETTISRYMSFASFLSLIKTEKLFFTALSTFSDKHEGSGTESNEIGSTGVMELLTSTSDYLRAVTSDLQRSNNLDVTPELGQEEIRRIRARHEEVIKTPRFLETPFGKKILDSDNHYRKIMSSMRRWLDVSCWHKNVDESLAMWKIYGGSAEAVCLHSKVGSLNSAIKLNPAEKKHIAVVKYIDYQDYEFDKADPLAPATHKQKPFDYEKEVRAIIWNEDQNIFDDRFAKGRSVNVDLPCLISSIRLSPAAQPWFKELVQTSIKGILDIKVEQSTLDRDPIL